MDEKVSIAEKDIGAGRIYRCRFRGTVPSECDIQGCSGSLVNLDGMSLTRFHRQGADITMAGSVRARSFPVCDLSGMDIANCKLDGMTINGIPVEGLAQQLQGEYQYEEECKKGYNRRQLEDEQDPDRDEGLHDRVQDHHAARPLVRRGAVCARRLHPGSCAHHA